MSTMSELHARVSEADRINTATVHGMDLYDAVYALTHSGRMRQIADAKHVDAVHAICIAILDEIERQCSGEDEEN